MYGDGYSSIDKTKNWSIPFYTKLGQGQRGSYLDTIPAFNTIKIKQISSFFLNNPVLSILLGMSKVTIFSEINSNVFIYKYKKYI